MNWNALCSHSKGKQLWTDKYKTSMENVNVENFTLQHTCMLETKHTCVFNTQVVTKYFSPTLPSTNCMRCFGHCCALLSSEVTFHGSTKTPKWFLITLTCTFALLWSVYNVRIGSSIDADSPIGDPGLVNTSFHPLHDKIQEDIHNLADILPVCSTCLKVWDSAPWGKSITMHYKQTNEGHCCQWQKWHDPSLQEPMECSSADSLESVWLNIFPM